MRLGLLSDLHWPARSTESASWHHPFDFLGLPGRIERARELFARAQVDVVVVAGDLTHMGDEPSTRAVVELLADRSPHPVLAVAGNHDCLERDDQLARCVAGMARQLAPPGAVVGGVRVAGVAIERDDGAGRFRSADEGDASADEPVRVVVSHFPVLSLAERLAEHGLAYPGDLTDRRRLHERLLGGSGAVVVLSGHVHARDAHAHGALLQLSAGALVEAPYEAAIVDVSVAGTQVRVRRRAHRLGPPAVRRDSVLAPADETWAFAEEGWRTADALAS